VKKLQAAWWTDFIGGQSGLIRQAASPAH